MTVPFITLTGPPRERGRAHGEALRDLIGETIERWRTDLAERVDPDRVISSVVADTGFLEAARRHAPDLVEEVRGIAQGSHQSFETMFAWQLLDEVWWYVDDVLDTTAPRERCSAFAINHRGRGIVGQTQDLPRHFDGSQTALHYVDEDGLEILAPSVAGLLALNGVNSAGFAACITTLSQLPHSPTGLASGFVVPMLLRCGSADEALALLKATPVASGNSFLFGSADASGGVEASSAGVVDLGRSDRHLRTNHVLASDTAVEFVRFDGSIERLAHLDQQLGSDSTIDDLDSIYRTPPVCQSRSATSDVMSIGTMFFELTEEPCCHYAPGPLDTDPLTTYRFPRSRPTTETR